MNRGVGIFILGMLIVLGAAMGSLYYANSELNKAQNLQLAPNEMKNLSYTLKPGKEYTVVITVNSTIKYSLQTGNGTTVKNGTVSDKVKFQFKASGDGEYVLVLKNSNKPNRVAVLVESTDEMNHISSTGQMLLGTCVLGIALVVAGIIIAVIMHKK
ncbi:MAG: hypothetical protein GXO25_00655 [Euryarchaeota archaeon]|nr:hypothetical protein [Euryarchaeota archaeon]